MRLILGLKALLDMAEKGEWEKLDMQNQELLLMMEAVCSSDSQFLIKIANPEQLEQILQLLHSAIHLCSARKDQIAPLVNAFAKAIDAPAKP
ncbi:MAG: hypothetical protein WBK19_15325 [Azonexus sp.]